jgi:hypothetical protein
MPRVFVSSTFGDLLDFRKAAREEAGTRGWQPVLLEDPGTASGWTVDYCRRQVRASNLLLLIVGFKRGTLPPADKGGDGIRSYTAYELAEAERHRIPVRVLMARENWPFNLCDSGADLEWVRQFRRQIPYKADFFEHEQGPLTSFRNMVARALDDHRRELDDLFRAAISGAHAAVKWPELHNALLLLEPMLKEVVVLRDAVRAAYRDAHPDGCDDLAEEGHCVRTLAEAVRRLASFPRQSGGGHPLRSFVERLAAATEEENHRARLCQWAAEAAGLLALGQPHPAPAAPPAPAAAPTAEDSADQHVVIRLDPSWENAEEHVVSAWLYKEGKPTPLRPEKESWVKWTKKNRAVLLGAIWRAARKAGGSPRRLVVEFVLPLSLLGEKVEQWPINIDGFAPARIGDRFPVVLGLRDRIVLEDAYKFLEDRCVSAGAEMWGCCRFVETAAAATRPAALWVADPADGDGLHRSLSADEAVACVVLGQPLSRTATRTRKKMNVIQAVLWTGIPILLWPREAPKSGPAVLREEVRRLLDGQTLDGLPRRLFKTRPGPLGDAEHLTLVWDDPARRKPDPADDVPLTLEAR